MKGKGKGMDALDALFGEWDRQSQIIVASGARKNAPLMVCKNLRKKEDRARWNHIAEYAARHLHVDTPSNGQIIGLLMDIASHFIAGNLVPARSPVDPGSGPKAQTTVLLDGMTGKVADLINCVLLHEDFDAERLNGLLAVADNGVPMAVAARKDGPGPDATRYFLHMWEKAFRESGDAPESNVVPLRGGGAKRDA